MPEQTELTSVLKARCQASPGRLGFPDSADSRVLQVAWQLLSEGSVRSVSLYSDQAMTEALAKDSGIDLRPLGQRIVWAATPEEATPAARLNVAATHLARDALEAVLAGNIATTADVIRAGIKQVGLAPGVRTVSGAFIMHRPARPSVAGATYLFADCGVVVAPTLTQLVDIAKASVATWRQLMPAEPPVVAFLSFSTKGSAKHPAAALMAEAAAVFHAESPEVVSDGELQVDAAFDAVIAARKAPGNPVKGRANCLIFPDLDAGNIGYKLTQRLGGFAAYGPILQGLAKPLNDLSRGATVDDILASAYIALSRAVRGA